MLDQFDKNLLVHDNHCHICFPQKIEDTLLDYESLFKELSIASASLLSCPDTSHCENGFDITETINKKSGI